MRTILLAAVDYAIVWAICVLACGLLSLFLPLSDPLWVGTGFWVLYGFIDLLIQDEKNCEIVGKLEAYPDTGLKSPCFFS